MNDDYLFDPKATPDPSVQELERALAPFRLQPDGAATPARARGRLLRALRRPRSWLAAALIVGAASLIVVQSRSRRVPIAPCAPWGGGESLALDEVEGSVRIGSSTVGGSSAEHPLVPGDRVVCDAGGRARLRVGDIGWLTLEEKTDLRVVAGSEAERGGGGGPDDGEHGEGTYRLDLARGTVSARIFAAPRVFWLGTPSGIAVDLGCVYKTTVDDEGHTTLAVVSGRVSFESIGESVGENIGESTGRKVYVPAHASCRAWPGFGPGTPAWDDASPELRAAVVRHDEARMRGESAAARREIELILVTDEPRDSLTLWHLLDAPEPDLRADVYDKLRELCPPPSEATRDLCLARDPAALTAWREELELHCW